MVRGLAYYTGVVFEGFDRAGELRAICGGGRYDKLLSLYGAVSEVPACGFGFGDCVVVELLKDKGILPSLPKSVDFVVAAFNENMQGAAMRATHLMREGGANVDLLLEPKKTVANTFDYANRVGARFIAFVAPSEWERGEVRIKDLRLGEDVPDEEKQLDVKVEDLGARARPARRWLGRQSHEEPQAVKRLLRHLTDSRKFSSGARASAFWGRPTNETTRLIAERAGHIPLPHAFKKCGGEALKAQLRRTPFAASFRRRRRPSAERQDRPRAWTRRGCCAARMNEPLELGDPLVQRRDAMRHPAPRARQVVRAPVKRRRPGSASAATRPAGLSRRWRRLALHRDGLRFRGRVVVFVRPAAA